MNDSAIQPSAYAASRQSRLDLLINGAAELASRSGSHAAQVVAAFIKNHAQLATPILGKGLNQEPLKGTLNFYIAPVISADELLPSADRYVRMLSRQSVSDSAALYRLPTRTIYIPFDWPISLPWIQISLLHEGLHAIDALTGRDKSLADWQCEVRARRLEESILLGLYGGPVMNRLLTELVPLVAHAAETGNAAYFDIPDSLLSDVPLLFGEALNRYDYSQQREHVRRLAILHYLRHIEASSESYKIAVPPDEIEASN